MLSTPDHLPPRTGCNLQDVQKSTVIELDKSPDHVLQHHDDEDIQEVSTDSITAQKKIPVISEVIHIQSY